MGKRRPKTKKTNKKNKFKVNHELKVEKYIKKESVKNENKYIIDTGEIRVFKYI